MTTDVTTFIVITVEMALGKSLVWYSNAQALFKCHVLNIFIRNKRLHGKLTGCKQRKEKDVVARGL